MYFNALPNAKTYQKTFFVIENGKCIRVEAETETEVIRYFGYGNVFKTQMECLNAINEMSKPKERKLSDYEIKQLLKAQREFGRSLMTQLDWDIRRENLKSIEQKQKEFARQMMGE